MYTYKKCGKGNPKVGSSETPSKQEMIHLHLNGEETVH